MSDTGDRDMLAAEYALGCLDGEELRAAERRTAIDPAFAQAVAAWQQRLTPLSVLAAPAAPPPDLWRRIEAATGVAQVRTDNVLPFQRRVRFWRGTTFAAMAIAASLAAFMVIRAPAPARVAVRAPMTGGVPVLVARAERDGALSIRPNGAIVVPDGKDLELWALARGETVPRSLGVLPADGRRLIASLAPDTQLLVSLEPRGGSPTGLPTGPVLYGGALTAVD